MASKDNINTNTDILDVDLPLIDSAVASIKKDCYDKLIENNKTLGEIIVRLTTEEWISDVNQGFINVTNEYIEKLNIIADFYNQITKDLQKIKIEMEIEMNKKPSIHFE